MPFSTVKSFKHLVVGLCASALCTLALAAGDAGGVKPPSTPSNTIVDKSPRCEPAAVSQCRTTCERKKIEGTDKAQIVKKLSECKQDCIRGC